MYPAAKETILACINRVSIRLVGSRKVKQENNLNELDSPLLEKEG